ncbi:protein-disulfide reductase DsbD domain-containing protein [Enhygromyxa salina]|uniref:protein-disulfide reductase DsbD domain-containing protein n=1 Tax=Enhygromyxa salina TaxID=215803 RepID=UPI0015E5BE42|nr:protein-disulfide reductase DsbD domain-containing protein [Enhygromyxa salina]
MTRIVCSLATASLALLLAGCKTGGTDPTAAELRANDEPGPSKVEPERPPLVTVELALVDDAARERLAARLGPGSSLAGAEALVAVRHQIEPGWHIYWKNPGETGLRTRLTVEAEHAEAGETLYPAPERFASEGGQQSYGWGETAVLFVPLSELGEGAQIELRSNYLACAQSCIPGESEVGARVAELAQASDAATVEMLARVPEPANARVASSWIDGALHLRPSAEDLQLTELFPYATETAILGNQDRTGDDLVLHYRFTGAPPAGAQGVLRATLAGQTRWLELAVPWPPA